jgi:hypothetical protein
MPESTADTDTANETRLSPTETDADATGAEVAGAAALVAEAVYGVPIDAAAIDAVEWTRDGGLQIRGRFDRDTVAAIGDTPDALDHRADSDTDS